jgi:hypothetical protein
MARQEMNTKFWCGNLLKSDQLELNERGEHQGDGGVRTQWIFEKQIARMGTGLNCLRVVMTGFGIIGVKVSSSVTT